MHFGKIEVADPDAEDFSISIMGLNEDSQELDNLGYASNQGLGEEDGTSNQGSSMAYNSNYSWSEDSLEYDDYPFNALSGDTSVERKICKHLRISCRIERYKERDNRPLPGP